MHFVRQSGIVPQTRNAIRDVGISRNADALAAVPGFELGEEVRVGFHKVGEFVEHWWAHDTGLAMFGKVKE